MLTDAHHVLYSSDEGKELPEWYFVHYIHTNVNMEAVTELLFAF